MGTLRVSARVEEIKPIDHLMALAERFEELRETCFVGTRIKCPSSGQVCSEVRIKGFTSYAHHYSARGECPGCGLLVTIYEKTLKVRQHNTSSHEPCCENRKWKLPRLDRRLSILLDIRRKHCPEYHPVDWMDADGYAAALAVQLWEYLETCPPRIIEDSSGHGNHGILS